MNALLLDLDDTLLDYSGGVDASWEAAVAAAAPPDLDQARLVAELAEVRRWFWADPERHRRERVRMLEAWTHIAEFALDRAGVARDGLADRIARQYAALRRAAQRLFPDTLDALRTFRRRGVPLALVTNGDASQQRDKIARHGLAPFFDVVLIEGELGYGKPQEAVYREALAALGAGPDGAWMAGDHLEFDVAAPQRLGLTGVWVNRSGAGLPTGAAVRPDRIVRSLAELAG